MKNQETSPTNYIYLPPSVNESHLAKNFDWEALASGQQKFFLVGADTKRLVATVTIPSRPHSAPLVSWAKEVPPSPFKRFKPFAAYLRGKTSKAPPPIEIEVNRTKKTEAYTQQRALLGKQMTVPAWYPLASVTVHPGSAPDGTRYLGIYPPGVSPATNRPLRAFTREESRVHLRPADADTLWTGLRDRANELRDLIVKVVGSNASTSRDAWLAIHELALAKPLLVSTLLLAKQSPFALHKEEYHSRLKNLSGWQAFRSGIEARLLEAQAHSVPFVAHLLVKAQGYRTFGRLSALSLLVDDWYAEPSSPIDLLTRLAVTAPRALEQSMNHLRDSHEEAVRELAGTGPIHEFLRGIGTPSRDRWKESL